MLRTLALTLLPGLALAQEDLPDFSWAGYRAGEQAPPRREPTVTLHAEEGDLTAALRAAVRQPGVVRIPAGRWTLRDVVEITRDGVVVQGAGSDRTVLFCPHSLTDLQGYRPGWSWSGGMLHVGPAGGGAQDAGRVIARAATGATRLEVRWRRRPQPGTWLELTWFNDTGQDTLLDHLYGGVIPRARMGQELQEATGPRVREWVLVREAGADFVVLAQPLRLEVRPAWRPTLRARPYVREVGLEGLRLEFPRTPYPGHLKEKGFNAIDLGAAIDCWVRDVKIVNADSGIFTHGCKRVTVSDVVIRGRTMHHCLAASWSVDCLFTRWRIEAPHVHGTTISWCAHGNVFSHGYGRALAMDAHRAASFENLHTAIVIDHGEMAYNVLRSGGSRPRGPHAARGNVYWNVEHRFRGRTEPFRIAGHAEWPLGVFVGWRANVPLRFAPVAGLRQRIEDLNEEPAIDDLHRWQLARRLSAR
ncbi:MAG: hypothetical protein ACYTEZ_18035 [Planctomycetota bacterium]